VGDGTRRSPDEELVIAKVSVLVPVVVCIGGDPPGTRDFGRSRLDERFGDNALTDSGFQK
jgi:hypothetical protein